MAAANDHSEGLIQARVDIGVLQTQMLDLRTGQAHMLSQLKDIQSTLAEAKGGWRVLMLLGGFGAALGSLATYLLQHFQIRG